MEDKGKLEGSSSSFSPHLSLPCHRNDLLANPSFPATKPLEIAAAPERLSPLYEVTGHFVIALGLHLV